MSSHQCPRHLGQSDSNQYLLKIALHSHKELKAIKKTLKKMQSEVKNCAYQVNKQNKRLKRNQETVVRSQSIIALRRDCSPSILRHPSIKSHMMTSGPLIGETPRHAESQPILINEAYRQSFAPRSSKLLSSERKFSRDMQYHFAKYMVPFSHSIATNLRPLSMSRKFTAERQERASESQSSQIKESDNSDYVHQQTGMHKFTETFKPQTTTSMETDSNPESKKNQFGDRNNLRFQMFEMAKSQSLLNRSSASIKG